MGAGSDSTVRRAHPILFGSLILFSIIEVSARSLFLDGTYSIQLRCVSLPG